MTPKQYRVFKPHRSPDPSPWIVRQGGRRSFEHRETEWPGWFWAPDSSGKRAWVPESWVESEGDSCTMKRDYNSVELSVEVGHLLTVEFEESGWAWATTVTGEGMIWIG